MRDLFSHHDTTIVGYYQSVLENAGILCFIRNYYESSNAVTTLFWPTLCITRDEDAPRATELLRGTNPECPPAAPDWTCPACKEEVPGTFDSCWKCGAERPA